MWDDLVLSTELTHLWNRRDTFNWCFFCFVLFYWAWGERGTHKLWHEIHVFKQHPLDVRAVRLYRWRQAAGGQAGDDLLHQSQTDAGQLRAVVMAMPCRSTLAVLAAQDGGKYHTRHLRSAVAGTRSGLKTPVHICQAGGGGSLSAAARRVLHAADSSVCGPAMWCTRKQRFRRMASLVKSHGVNTMRAEARHTGLQNKTHFILGCRHHKPYYRFNLGYRLTLDVHNGWKDEGPLQLYH